MKQKLLFLFAITALVFCSSCEKECKGIVDYESSVHRISVNEMKELVNNYQSNILPVIDSLQNNQDGIRDPNSQYYPTEYVWVSLDELKNYVCMLEEVERLNGREISGVAINFGAFSYDKQVTANEKRQINRTGDYKKRLTTVLNPTFLAKGNVSDIRNHKQFYIQPEPKQENKFKGSFTEIDFSTPSFSENVVTSEGEGDGGGESEPTSLSFDDLSSMPPKP